MEPIPYFKNRALQSMFDRARLIIFDMNGLIIDDEALQLHSVNLALEPFGITVSERYWIEHCVGKRADEYFTSLLKGPGGMEVLHLNEAPNNADRDKPPIKRLPLKRPEGAQAPADIREVVAAKNRFYHLLIAGEVKNLIRPGVLELFTYLSNRIDQKVALATSAHPAEIETILGEGGLRLKHRFHFIVSGIEVEKSKPDPQIYTRLLRLTGVTPGQCLVLEDSGIGVAAARMADMVCIAIPNRFTQKQDFSGAAYILDNLTRDAKAVKP